MKPYKPVRSISQEERQAAKNLIPSGVDNATICELIRRVHAEGVASRNVHLTKLAVDIFCYAKRMNSALRRRNARYDLGWWMAEDDEGVPFTTA